MTTWQIIIAERGWVFVGQVDREGDQVVLNNCYNIRQWGTTAGLGEIAQDGPTSESVLDSYGVVRVHVLAVVASIDCNDAAWNRWLKQQQRRR